MNRVNLLWKIHSITYTSRSKILQEGENSIFNAVKPMLSILYAPTSALLNGCIYKLINKLMNK